MNPFELPKLSKYINDFSNVLATEQIISLNQLFIEHENKTTEQVVTVFIPNREGNELLDIGLKVFNENGIGQKNLNNGLLLIVATEEKKLRIIVGKGLELKYTEMVCRDIIENQLRPLLNEGKYEELLREWNEIIIGGANIIIQKSAKRKASSRIERKIPGVCIIGLFFYILLQQNPGLMVIFFALLLGIVFLILGAKQLTCIISGNIKHNHSLKKGVLLLIISFITFGIALVIANKTTCGSNLHCKQSIFGYEYTYQNSIPEDTYNGSSYSSSRSNSDHDSSSSSFNGGGGSSNGGGYGD